MTNRIAMALLLASLSGCFAQVEDNSVTLTQSLCTGGTDCIPGLGAPLTVVQVNGNNTYTVSIGDQPLLKSSTSLGPATLKTTLLLNRVVFDLTTASPASFNNVSQVTLLAVNPGVSTAGNPCATASNCTTIATYTQSPSAPADRQLVLNTTGADLITLIDPTTHNLTVQIQASGNAPTTASWNANASMDMALKSRANFP
jgi:hypothetical protein